MTDSNNLIHSVITSDLIADKILPRDERSVYLQKFTESGWPTGKHEEWRFTSLNGFRNLAASDIKNTRFIAGESISNLAELISDCNHIVLQNGVWNQELSTLRDAALEVYSLTDEILLEKEWFTQNFNQLINKYQDPVVWLNRSMAQSGICIHVPNNSKLEFPILISSNNHADETINHSRYFVHLGNHAAAELYWEDQLSENTHVNDIIECKIETSSSLHFYGIVSGKQGSEFIQSIELHQEEKSNARMVSLNLNGKLTRKNWHLRMLGHHSYNDLSGIYLASLNDVSDNHVLVDHMVENCQSNQLFKGILTDNGKGVFNGKIYVREGAQKTLAYQSNKSLLLSENAEVNAKPQLEILADDVKCSHGATVGQLDADALFYLKARGIPEDSAKHILTQAFCADVLAKIQNEAVREYLSEEIIKVLNLS